MAEECWGHVSKPQRRRRCINGGGTSNVKERPGSTCGSGGASGAGQC